MLRLSRRKFIAAAILATPGILYADAKWVEPTWLKTSHLRIGNGKPSHRFIHFKMFITKATDNIWPP